MGLIDGPTPSSKEVKKRNSIIGTENYKKSFGTSTAGVFRNGQSKLGCSLSSKVESKEAAGTKGAKILPLPSKGKTMFKQPQGFIANTSFDDFDKAGGTIISERSDKENELDQQLQFSES
jgi:hypothetical protein